MNWELFCEGLESMDNMSSEEILKAAVSATGIAIDGTINPGAARRYFNLVTDQSSFLGRVSTEFVNELKRDIDVFSISQGALQRVNEGTAPTTLTGVTNSGNVWALKAVQLFADINFSTIVQRQKNGENIDAYLAGMFATAFRNDLLYLGVVGDEDSGTPFNALNDGWIELAQDAVSGTDRDADNVVDTTVTHTDTFDNMLDQIDDKYKIKGPNGLAFLMSSSNYDAWVKEMGAESALGMYLVSGKVPTYMGYECIGIPNFPADTFLLTRPENLAFAMGTTIQRYRNVNGRKRCVEYTWNLYCDYQLIDNAAIVYSDTAA